MGRDTDFEFGANQNAGSIADDLPRCMGMVVCDRCRKSHGRCDEMAELKSRPPKEKYGMNVGAYIKAGQGERNPFITAKEVGKSSKWKIIASNAVTTPKFTGLILNLKLKDKKRAYGVRFDGYDLSAIVAQTGSEDTDDWNGQMLSLVTKKGSKGGMFVNVAQKSGHKK